MQRKKKKRTFHCGCWLCTGYAPHEAKALKAKEQEQADWDEFNEGDFTPNQWEYFNEQWRLDEDSSTIMWNNRQVA